MSYGYLLQKWENLEPSARSKFLPFAPDFMIELLSLSDRAETTRQKMQEYIDNGTKLGWLINRKQQEVEIYSPTQALKVLTSPTVLTAEDLLPNFQLSLTSIW
ncbi:MAG: Uma2 family endonuclease [Limnothrix sp.]